MNTVSEREDGYRLGRKIITAAVLSEFFILSGNLFVRLSQRGDWLPSWGNALVAVVSAVPMVFLAIYFFRMIRRDLDEMVQRVVLEGLAIAMVILIPLTGLYVNARAAGIVRLQLDPPEILLVPSLLAAIGIGIAWSRLK